MITFGHGLTLGGDMVYSIGRKEVYGVAPIIEPVGGDASWLGLKFLDPESVDPMTRGDKVLELLESEWAQSNPVDAEGLRRSRIRDIMGRGYPIDPATAPKAYLWRHRKKSPPDYATGNNTSMIVSSKFRDLVESYEPEVHQFLPVDLYYSKKDDVPFAQFYWFICCNLIDSLDRNATTLDWKPPGKAYQHLSGWHRGGRWERNRSAHVEQVAVFSLEAIGSKHLWRDPCYERIFYVRCSDHFAQAMMDAGLTGFAYREELQV